MFITATKSMRRRSNCRKDLALLPLLIPAGLAAAAWIALWTSSHALAAPECTAPQPVCAMRAAVFAISSKFDRYGSAVRVGADLLVTNRHLLADEKMARVRLPDGRWIDAAVVPSDYRDDLLILRATLPDGPVAQISDGPVSTGAQLFTIGAGLGKLRGVEVHAAGKLMQAPAAGKPSARLHHTAYVERGNSGGALVDAGGRLVGITASGGEGRFEAMPASHVRQLLSAKGPAFAFITDAVGKEYRNCYEAMEKLQHLPTQMRAQKLNARMRRACEKTGNRQLMDLAAQVLGRARLFKPAIELFEKSLALDPNAVNTRLSLAITLTYARRYKNAIAPIRRLMALLPKDTRVQKMALQVGKFAPDKALAADAMALIKQHDPRGLPRARRFLDGTPGGNGPPQRQNPNRLPQSRPAQ